MLKGKHFGIAIDCLGEKWKCPLGVTHPPANPDVTVSTFPLGCIPCEQQRIHEVPFVTAEERMQK